MKRFVKKMFANYDRMNKENITTPNKQTAEIIEQAKALRDYPVSPFFTQRVLANAKAMNREVWDYMNFIPQSKMRLAMITLVLLIVTVINIPVNDQDTAQAQSSSDFQYIVSGETSNMNLDTNDKVLQFALSN